MLTLSGRSAKEEVLDLLRKVLHTILFPHLNMAQRDAVMEHLAWMRSQRPDLSVTCKFETVPELRLTRIVIEAGFEPERGMQ